MDATGLVLALLLAAPFIVFLSRISYREYDGFLGRLWNKYGEKRMDAINRRFICFGIYAGIVVGFLSTWLVMFLNTVIFGSNMLWFAPAEPVAWTLQIAFIQAGLIEEMAKCGLALILCLLISHKNSKQKTGKQVFCKTTPFICAAVGLGFAIRENVDYISMGLNMSGLIPVLFARMMANIAHMLFVLNFGLYLYSSSKDNWKSRALTGLIVSVMLHGIYDFFALPPVLFASILTYVFLFLITFFIMRRLFIYFPDKKPVNILFVGNENTLIDIYSNIVATNPENTKLEKTPVYLKNKSAKPSPYQDQFAEKNITQPQPNNMNSNQSTIEEKNQETQKEFFCDEIPNFGNISFEFKNNFSKYKDSEAIPKNKSESGFLITELASVLGLGTRVAMYLDEKSFRGDIPSQYLDVWESSEVAISKQINSKKQADFVWDSSIFAQDASKVYLELKEAGVDLEKLSPFRILEYRDVKLEDGIKFPYIYMTQGLEILYGHEFYFTFFSAMPSMRWFLLRLASIPADQAPWIREFVPMFVKNSYDVGEPRGWWKGFVPVPLFGFQKEIFEKSFSDSKTLDTDKLPLSIMMLSVSDLTWISGFGIGNFFEHLNKKNISLHNDLKRPVLSG